jgi:hypothetical protein
MRRGDSSQSCAKRAIACVSLPKEASNSELPCGAGAPPRPASRHAWLLNVRGQARPHASVQPYGYTVFSLGLCSLHPYLTALELGANMSAFTFLDVCDSKVVDDRRSKRIVRLI